MDPIGGAALGTNIPSSPGARARNRAFEQPMTTSGRAPPTASATCSSAARPSVVAKSLGGGARAEDGGEVRAQGRCAGACAVGGPTPLTVDVQSAETETDARERVRFYEVCSPRMLGDWTDDRTCVVNVTGGMGASQGAGEELIRISENRLGVVMEVDTKRERVRVNHEIPNVVIEAARILHLQIEQAKMVTEGSGGENNAPTPTPKFGYAKSVDDEAVMHEILRDISQAEIEELRRQVESKRATRQRLIETLGEPRVTCHLQPIELTSTPFVFACRENTRSARNVCMRSVSPCARSPRPTPRVNRHGSSNATWENPSFMD